jgi:basic membrane protein A
VVLTAVGFVATGAAAPQAPFKAGLVSDVGRFNDRGFNQNQLTGLKRAQKELKVQIRAVESRSAGDYLPNMASLARQGFGIVMSAGFLLADATNEVARQFPNIKFAITDYSATDAPFKGEVTNVEGLTYATQQNGYLIGCLAAKVAARQGNKNISAVGGLKIPSVDTFIAGYKAGAAKCVPGTTVQIGYSQNFIASDLCKAVATNQLDAGSVFAVAGPCGLGALDAAKGAGKWGVGVDVDQSNLGSYILTSAVKRVDVGIFLAVRGAKTGKGYKGGGNLVFNLKNNGVSLGKISKKAKIPKAWLAQIAKLKAQIIAGKIKPPTVVPG